MKTTDKRIKMVEKDLIRAINAKVRYQFELQWGSDRDEVLVALIREKVNLIFQLEASLRELKGCEI